jgi:hypothetical protein
LCSSAVTDGNAELLAESIPKETEGGKAFRFSIKRSDMQKFVLIISLLFSAAMGVYLGIQYPPARLKDMMEEHTSMLTEAVAHDRTNDNKAIILPTPTASLAEQTPDEECELATKA